MHEAPMARCSGAVSNTTESGGTEDSKISATPSDRWYLLPKGFQFEQSISLYVGSAITHVVEELIDI